MPERGALARANDSYVALPQMTYRSGDHELRPIAMEEIELIRAWRNAQIPILRQNRWISADAQDEYFRRDVWPDLRRASPHQVLLMLTRCGSPIGYGGLTHIDWDSRRTELSFLADPARVRRYRADFDVGLLLLVRVAFEGLGLRRIWHETYDVRPEHVRTLEDFGFVLEGRLRSHVRIDGHYHDALIHGLVRTVS